MYRHKINGLLESRGMTRYELAQKSGISLKQIYQLMATDDLPPNTRWHTLARIRDALGLAHVEDMIEDESENSV